MCRAGWERDLRKELGGDAEILAEGLVACPERPRGPDGHLLEPAFGRQAMKTDADRCSHEVEILADQVAAAMQKRRPKKGESPWRWHLQVVAPDSTNARDPRKRWAARTNDALVEPLLARLPEEIRAKRMESPEEAQRLVQVWPVDDSGVLVGVTVATQALSRVPGGRIRLKREEDSPSRSGLKLEEAIRWIGVGPEGGDRVADLGAAPGGWSQVAVKRGAHVVAVDPARIKVALPHRRFTHLQQSAFDYAPEETLDWVLCDMAWRPLEVGKLLAKWGRRAWARQLMANIKLPMKKRAEMLDQVLRLLEDAGWRGIKARQLVYDRDEVTLFAWLDPHLVTRGAQAPFELKSKGKKKTPPRGRKKKKPRKKSIKR